MAGKSAYLLPLLWARHAPLRRPPKLQLLQVKDEAAARSVAAGLTRKALDKAPGLDVSVVRVDLENGEVTSADVDKVFGEVPRN